MDVSLVIPARNAAATLGACLEAVTPLLGLDGLREILVVDDGSTDATRSVAAGFPVRVLAGQAAGPGAARNLGWRAASQPLVWFLDADCVAEPEALSRLRRHFEDPRVAAAGGSYGNMRPDSLLACLIQEEIAARHRRMPAQVDFLATFDVVYRRDWLESVGGFDEALLRAQDAELAYRIRAAGGILVMERGSRVRHFHPTRLGRYLRAQEGQGYWRVALYHRHPRAVRGDSYSNTLDHVQPPLALLACLGLPLAFTPLGLWALTPAALLALAALPMTAALVRQTGRLRYASFLPLAMARALARGWGLARGGMTLLGYRGTSADGVPGAAGSR